MHIWIKPTLLSMFNNTLKNDRMYEIKDFIVNPYTTKYKWFASENHICFTQETAIKRLILKNLFHVENCSTSIILEILIHISINKIIVLVKIVTLYSIIISFFHKFQNIFKKFSFHFFL